MFASIRRYRLRNGSMDELTRRVDDGFAEIISAKPGFLSYEFLDCGGGEIATVSVFAQAAQADASQELARQWTMSELGDLDFTRLDALRGEVAVSRAADDMLEPGHVPLGHGFASMRRYRAAPSEIGSMLHLCDLEFADRIEGLEGFEAYHVIDCGDEIVSLSMMRDRSEIATCDGLAREFVTESLGGFDIERTETLTGAIVVSRAQAGLLVAAHA